MFGNTTSSVEVTNISRHGFWLLLGDEELLLPFEQFPWFRSATVAQITDVERPSPGHLYWPGLDVDLSVESIRNPKSFLAIVMAPVVYMFTHATHHHSIHLSFGAHRCQRSPIAA